MFGECERSNATYIMALYKRRSSSHLFAGNAVHLPDASKVRLDQLGDVSKDLMQRMSCSSVEEEPIALPGLPSLLDDGNETRMNELPVAVCFHFR